MPLLHIKLGLRKNFTKVMAKQSLNGFEFLCRKFPKLSQAKKKWIFVGPQIWTVLDDPEFERTLNTLELWVWHVFEWICSNFLKISVKFVSRRCCRVACNIQRGGVLHVLKDVFSLFTLWVFS